MAGVKGRSGKSSKKGLTGGYRPGSGRKWPIPDAEWRKRLEDALVAAAERRGKTPEEILADYCCGIQCATCEGTGKKYQGNVVDDEPCPACAGVGYHEHKNVDKFWKLMLDYTKVKETKQTVEKTVTNKTAILLPAMNPDPASDVLN